MTIAMVVEILFQSISKQSQRGEYFPPLTKTNLKQNKMEKYIITIKSYYNNKYRNIYREFDSQDNLNKYVSAVNNSGYSKVIGIKNVTEQRLKNEYGY